MDLDKKYRPSSLETYIGQPAAVKQVMGIIKSKRFPSVLHINGPSGYGKTTLARIVAAMYNGHKDTKDYAGSPDLVERNMSDKRGIEDARNLANAAEYKPTKDKFRVYILDEIQGITQSSSGALLKIMEEPPETTKFIVCTNQPEKVLQTLRRRGETIKLHTPSEEAIKKFMVSICKKEKVNVDKRILKVVFKECRLQPAMALNLLGAVFSTIQGGGSLEEQLATISQVCDTDVETTVFSFICGCYTGDIKKPMQLLYHNKMDLVDFCTRAMDVNAQLHVLIENGDQASTDLMAALLKRVRAKIKDGGVSKQVLMWLHASLADLRIKAMNNQVISDNHDLLAILLKNKG